LKYTLQINSENLFAGSDWSWSETLADYPSDTYDLTLLLKYPAIDVIILNGAANVDSGFDFAKPSAETSLLIEGEYFCQALIVKKSDSTKTVFDLEKIKITALLSANQDPRTYWQLVFDTVKESYLRLVNNETIEETYEGKTYKYADAGKLRSIMNDAESRIASENNSGISQKIYYGKFV
jgi:hypothetical protein